MYGRDKAVLPVAHEESVPPPFVPEYVFQNASVFRDVFAVDSVVGSHDRFWVAEPRREHERQEIDFSQRTLSNDGIDCHTFMFLIVTNKMLDSSAYMFILEPIDVACCKLAG